MKKLILENRWKLVISTLLILCPQLAASFLGETIYWLPFQCLVLHWFCLLITFHDWSRRPQGKRIVSLVIWMVPAISIMGSGLVLIVKTGQISSAIIPYLMYVGFGLMFLVVGNYFPKIRQNHTMGIKVKWALEDEENWNATHRFGGKVWAACGFFCLLLVLFPPDSFVSVLLFILAVFAAALLPTVYSWQYYRGRLRRGEVVRTNLSRKGLLATVFLIAAVGIFVVWALLSGTMAVSFQEEEMVIDASGWGGYEVKYEEVEDISYEPDGVSDGENDRRTNGFGNLKLAMGRFRNDRFGDYVRYTFNGCRACVVLEVRGETVVVNGEDEAATEEIYQQLEQKCRISGKGSES